MAVYRGGNGIMKTVFGLLLLGAAASPLGAQATLVKREAPLEPRREAARSALYELRDSVASVRSAATRLRLDLRSSSGATLISRVNELARHCEVAGRHVAPVRAMVDSAPPVTRLERQEYQLLIGWLDSLPNAFSSCAADFGAMARKRDGEEIRGYANRRAEPLLKSINEYENEVRSFFRAYRMEYRPLGVGKNPLAG